MHAGNALLSQGLKQFNNIQRQQIDDDDDDDNDNDNNININNNNNMNNREQYRCITLSQTYVVYTISSHYTRLFMCVHIITNNTKMAVAEAETQGSWLYYPPPSPLNLYDIF